MIDARPAPSDVQDGDLAAAGGRADEQEIRDVEARNREQHRHGAIKDDEGRLNLAGQLLAQRPEVHAGALVEVVGRRQSACDPAEIRSGSGNRSAWLHPGNGIEEATGHSPPVESSIQLKRRPHVVVLEDEAEILRHHADDRGRRAVHLHDAADHLRVAVEALLPQPIADHGDARSVGTIVGGGNRAAEQRANAEHRKEFGGHSLVVQAHGFAHASQCQRVAEPHCDVVERVIVALPVEPVRGRDAGARRAYGGVEGRGGRVESRGHEQQLLAVWIGQRPQQHLVDDGEDRRVAPDADRQRQDHRRGEAGTSPQAARHVTDVAHQVLDRRGPSLVMPGFLQPDDAAEAAAGFGLGIGPADA